MKRFVMTVVALKLALVIGFFTLFVASQTAVKRDGKAAPAPTPSRTNDSVSRPVSEPYNGDLGIFEGENRAKNLQIDRVMDILQITAKMNVADIGAGSGWFTLRAAKRAEKGTVYAVEINQQYIDHINGRVLKENVTNIKTILGKPDDPMLPQRSVDAVMILKTYHEIAEPIRFLKNLRKALKKGALVSIIDKNGKGGDHGLNAESVVEEAARAGFVLVEKYDFVKDGMDYFLVFRVAK